MRFRTCLVSILVFACGTAPLAAQSLTSVVAFSVHDEPVDGLGDTFNASTSLVRTQSTRADRAMHEFDANPIAGQLIVSATVSGTVSVNNAFDNGVRTFDFELYAGNGIADLDDYQIPGTVVGSGSYQPPIDTSFSYSFDVTATLQQLIDCGATFIGLKCIGTSSPNFPNSLGTPTLTVTTGGPQPTWTDLGFATAGTHGEPRLGGVGILSADNPTTLSVCNALPNSPGVLIIGLSRIDFPILGATLVPSPDLAGPAPVGPDGMQQFTVAFPPPGGGGISVYFQYWVVDPAAPQGLAVTNAVSVIAP